MAAPTLYQAQDAGAPQLDGTAGSLVNVLTACLVNGYGSKAAAGWTLAFSATNRAAYRQAAGNQFYLDVDDRGASGVLTGASGQEAAVRGYEAMTALSTGTNPFPTTVQVAAATANWRKSSTADSIPRGWWMLADDRTFYLGVVPMDSTDPGDLICFFGDFYSFQSADGFRTAIAVRTSVNNTSSASPLGGSLATSYNGTSTGFYVARVGAGTGTSQQGAVVTISSGIEATASWISAAGVTTPDGNVYLTRWNVSDAVTPFIRGYLRGVWSLCTPGGLSDGDVISGTGDLSTRTFLVLGPPGGALVSRWAFETTAWDTSS